MKTMKAVVLREIGAIDKLHLEEVAFPNVAAGQAVVALKAAALNHRDWWIVQGLYAKIRLPTIPGSDGAGIVQQVGTEEDAHWIGKKVIINPSMNWGDHPKAQGSEYRILGMPDNGTLAEYVTVPVEHLVEKPEYLSMEEAAAIPLAGLTAYRALFVHGRLQRGETVLITGIGGGVASLAMEMALRAGARAVVTSGDKNKIQQAVARGAAFGIVYGEENAYKLAQAELDRMGGVDLVLDGAGGDGINDLLGMLKPGGRLVVYGATAGNPSAIDLRRVFWKQLTVQGSTMGNSKDFHNMVRFFERHRIRPVVDGIFVLSDFSRAFSRMKDGIQSGKIVLKISG
jgi:NADPH:quinone reductase-like Zn-dependent oxidoreductase